MSVVYSADVLVQKTGGIGVVLKAVRSDCVMDDDLASSMVASMVEMLVDFEAE